MIRNLAFVIFPGFQLLDVAGPIAAFEIASRYAGGAYHLHVIAPEAGMVPSSSGIGLPALGLGDPTITSSDLHTVMFSGGDGTRNSETRESLVDFARDMHRAGVRMASVCSGAYFLAEAGLLDGRCATTHWSRTADFARRYPKVRLQADRIYACDDDIWTSAGISAGIDLSLAIIASDLGEQVAKDTARQLVVYYRRPGGQSQFSPLTEVETESRFSDLLAWARAHLNEPLDVAQLARESGMSERNFTRCFRQDLGTTPAKMIERIRVDAARTLLTAGHLRIEDIALEVGFGDAERMRRAVIRVTGHPPQSLRRNQT
jgi:transcriptional regulator GlxA family with amidase domain